jgi:predicted nucleic acid-binding protein
VILLDSNVISALMRPDPDGKVLAWCDRQPRSSIWTTSITVFEIQFGLQIMPAGEKRDALLAEMVFFLDRIEHRVAPFDEEAARHAAELMALRQKRGRPVELRDTMIAGIVLARHAALATRNIDHFDDLSASIVNPWAA